MTDFLVLVVIVKRAIADLRATNPSQYANFQDEIAWRHLVLEASGFKYVDVEYAWNRILFFKKQLLLLVTLRVYLLVNVKDRPLIFLVAQGHWTITLRYCVLLCLDVLDQLGYILGEICLEQAHFSLIFTLGLLFFVSNLFEDFLFIST